MYTMHNMQPMSRRQMKIWRVFAGVTLSSRNSKTSGWMRNRERSAGCITSSKKRDFCQIHPSDTWYRSIANSAPDNFFQNYKTKPEGLLRVLEEGCAKLHSWSSHHLTHLDRAQRDKATVEASGLVYVDLVQMCTHVRANVLFLTPSVNVTSMLSNLIHNLSSIKHGHRSIRI